MSIRETEIFKHVWGASLGLWLLVGCPGSPAGPGDESTGATSAASEGEGSATGSTGSTTSPTGGEPTETTAVGETGPGETGATEPVATTDAASTTGEATSAGETAGSTGEAGTSTSGTTGDASEGTDTGGDSTGDCALGPKAAMTATALEAAVDGVLYSSESDYPWVVETFACAAPVTEANVKEIIAPVYVPHPGGPTLEERAIEVRTLAQLFDPLTVPKDWWGDYEFEQAMKYAAIRMVLEDNLTDLIVLRLGEQSGNTLMGAIDVYVFGTTAEGDLVAMWTVSVET